MKAFLPIAMATVMLFLLLTGCGSPFGGDTLSAVRIGSEPAQSDWERAVPLDLEVWMGNVNLRPEVVALDQETSHRSTAQCHHGPANSEPVKVRLRALYTDRELYLLVRWTDPTEDRELGQWDRKEGRWSARPGADDGFAILWGIPEGGAPRGGVPRDGAPRDGVPQDGALKEGVAVGDAIGQRSSDGTPFRCQESCHMMEVDVYDGGTQMLMG